MPRIRSWNVGGLLPAPGWRMCWVVLLLFMTLSIQADEPKQSVPKDTEKGAAGPADKPNQPAPPPVVQPPGRQFFPPMRNGRIFRQNPGVQFNMQAGRPAVGNPVRFTTDRTQLKRLMRGQDLLEKGNFGEAVRSLQAILDADEDSFYIPEPDDPALPAPAHTDGKHSGRSLKLESQRLIGALPPAGRESYEIQFGTTARLHLDEALKTGDPALLSLVTRRYFHTQAGYDATYRLATEHLDHARPRSAALCFDRLRQAPEAKARFEPMLSLKTALAWERAGMENEALQTLLELKRDYPLGKLTLGGRELALFGDSQQALAWLAATLGVRVQAPPAMRDEWAMVRGDAARTAPTAGGSPYLNGGWHASLISGVTGNPDQEANIDKMLSDRQAAFRQSAEDRNLSAIPSGQPLIVGGLALVRSFGDTRAYSLASGKLVWATGEKDKTLQDVVASYGNPQLQAQGYSPLSKLLTQRAWRDLTFGTLSSDGELVFVVEDTGFVGPWLSGPGTSQALATRDDNRLASYDVRTGKAVWETGGPRGNFGDELAGTFFLGPPLVIGTRLYCLGETGGEIRLLVLHARSGKLDWSQTLALAEVNLLQDPYRRQSGASPSYADGVLVCPTETGAVVAVDPTTRQLLWGYRYPNAVALDARMPRGLFQSPMAQNSNGVVGNDDRWLESLSLIVGGRILLNPRDGNELLCLNALDGTLLWKRPRGDGLYIGGVEGGKVLIVGRSHVEALQIADGAMAWPERTLVPMPSGRGFISGGHYQLPLTTGEVAMIDFGDGRIVTRSKSRDGRIPGNLVGAAGMIVSQGADYIDCFKQVEALEAEVTASLKANPDDARALAMRGEIYLQRGKIKEAYADLKRALELDSADAHVREVLLGSLLEGLRVDFATYRAATTDIERLLTDPEQRLTFLRLTAHGLERLGEKNAAFDTYLRLTDPSVPESKLERIDAGISVRYARLVRARSTALYQSASAEQRMEMDREIRSRLEAAREKKSPEPLRRLLGCFGNLGPADEARRLLAELLAAEGSWLEAERWLRELEDSPDAPTAAWASARLAALLIEAGRPADSIPAIERVIRKWPDVVCLEGKTGAQLAAEWKKQPDIARESAHVSPWPTGLVEVERVAIPPNADAFRVYKIPVAGQREPYFADTVFLVDQRSQELRAHDKYGKQLWKLEFDSPSAWSNPYTNRAYTLDHFVLLQVGTQIAAIDALGTSKEPGARILWQQSLVDPASAQGLAVNMRPVLLAGGVQQFIAVDSLGQPLGSIGPVTHDYVCLQRGRKLMALDHMTGSVLWTRDDVIPGSELFGDEELVFVIPPDSEEAVVYKALDGTLLGTREVPPGIARMATRGRTVIAWNEVDNKQVLKLKDVWSGNELWKHEFAAGSRPALIELDELAVFEPQGRFAAVRLADGKLMAEGWGEPSPMTYQIIVFRSQEQYTLIANVPLQANNNEQIRRYGSQSIVVNGNVFGFERKTGKKLWSVKVERQSVDVLQPADLPVLTFACQYGVIEAKPGVNNRFETRFEVLCLDKRNGRIVYRDKQHDQSPMVMDITADPDSKRLEVKLTQAVLRLTFTDKPLSEEPAPAK